MWPPAVIGQRWWFDVDLAGLFGEDLQATALDRVRADLAALGVEVDAEADVVSVSAADPESITRAAIAVLTRAGRPAPGVEDAVRELAAVRIGRRQAWQAGDLFTVPLHDGRGAAEPVAGERFTLGQIVGVGEGGGPTIAWFDAFADRFLSPADIALETPVLAVLHTVGENLDDGRFRVIGHTDVLADPSLAKRGSSTGDGALIGLARAYLGLDPGTSSPTADTSSSCCSRSGAAHHRGRWCWMRRRAGSTGNGSSASAGDGARRLLPRYCVWMSPAADVSRALVCGHAPVPPCRCRRRIGVGAFGVWGWGIGNLPVPYRDAFSGNADALH